MLFLCITLWAMAGIVYDDVGIKFVVNLIRSIESITSEVVLIIR